MRFLIGYTVFVALCFLLAWLFGYHADNPDARSLAQIAYIPCIFLVAVGAIAWIAVLFNRL